jgi:hypothetical protein
VSAPPEVGGWVGEGGDVSSLTESLGQVMAVDGVRAAALIDIATGMVVQSAGEEGPGFPAAAVSMADEARMARAALGPGRPGGDLDEISLVTGSRLHLSKVLGSRLVGRLAPAVLA